jgi:4-diphosphocytidyl-2C-methyl-D-erythritol kinase
VRKQQNRAHVLYIFQKTIRAVVIGMVIAMHARLKLPIEAGLAGGDSNIEQDSRT